MITELSKKWLRVREPELSAARHEYRKGRVVQLSPDRFTSMASWMDEARRIASERGCADSFIARPGCDTTERHELAESAMARGAAPWWARAPAAVMR